MGIRGWHYCIVVSYIVINYTTAKPFSLNKALDAEVDQTQITETATSKFPEKASERFSLNKVLKRQDSKTNIFKETDNLLTRVRKISPLKYRKTFEIKTPLKPKKIKRSPKSKYRRKNQSVKREISGNEQLNQKYIPLLKSIGMLFDNLLSADDSSSYERRPRKYKRNKYESIFSEETNGVECPCEYRRNNEDAKPKAPEKTVIFEATTNETSTDSEVATTTTETAYTTPTSDFSTIGQYQNVSLLFPRNTTGSWRNDNGISERSSSTYNGSVKRNFTGNYGDSEYSTGCGQTESIAKNGDEIACHDSRISTGGDRSLERRRRNGNNTRNQDLGFALEKADITAAHEDYSKAYGHTPEYKGQNKSEMGRNETESTKSLSELIRRLRGYVSEIEVTTSSHTIQPQKVYKKSVFDVAHNNTSYQQFPHRSNSITEEDQTIGSRNETIILTKSSTNPDNQRSTKSPPVVMIIDGYSVTRHKNGENKVTKKAIHIHS